MVIPHDERTFILDEYADGTPPHEIAKLLIQRRALQEVEGVLHDHAGTLSMAQAAQDRLHFVYIAPHKPGEDIQPVRVFLNDLPALCKLHGLNEKNMVRVAMGEIDQEKGWTQGPADAYFCQMVPRAMVLAKQAVKEGAQREKKANPPAVQTRTVTRSPVSKPPTTFKPGE